MTEEPNIPRFDIERALDDAIQGLVSMDVEMLLQLAHICGMYEGQPTPLVVSRELHARLAWKLLLLDRLLRQTRVNLRILGLEHAPVERGLRSPADGYALLARR